MNPLISVCGSGTVIDLKLRGNPWGHNESVQESLEAKDFIATLKKKMTALGFNYLVGVAPRSYASGPIMFFHRYNLRAKFALGVASIFM